jgi:endo-alpha-1,4-polygalactosaminidase (GH114 family)
MDVWSLEEKSKVTTDEIEKLKARVKHIEEYLEKMNSKLELINKAGNEAISNKKDKSSSVRTKRSSAKKS